MGEMRSAYKIFVGKPEEKRQLRRAKCRWQDNIRMEVCGLGYGPVAGSCEPSTETPGSIKGGKFLDYLSNY